MTVLAHRLRAKEQKRRRQSFVKKILLIVLVLICLIAGILWALLSERFLVSAISINGAKRIPEEDVRLYIEEWLSQKRFIFFPERAYWFLDDEALATGLKSAFSQIRQVSAQKDFPTRLAITVEEYDGWGVLCRGNPEECFWIDYEGVAFEPAPGFSGLIVPKVKDERARDVKLGERGLSESFMRIASFFNERAVSDADLQSVEFILDAKDETVRIKTRAGWEILLSEDSDPERAYKNLRASIDGDIKGRTKDLLYIDLRFGNRIFYKFHD